MCFITIRKLRWIIHLSKSLTVVLLRKKRVTVVFVHRPIWFWILKHNLLLDIWKDRISKLTCHPFSVLSSPRNEHLFVSIYSKIKVTHILVLSNIGFILLKIYNKNSLLYYNMYNTYIYIIQKIKISENIIL